MGAKLYAHSAPQLSDFHALRFLHYPFRRVAVQNLRNAPLDFLNFRGFIFQCNILLSPLNLAYNKSRNFKAYVILFTGN